MRWEENVVNYSQKMYKNIIVITFYIRDDFPEMSLQSLCIKF